MMRSIDPSGAKRMISPAAPTRIPEKAVLVDGRAVGAAVALQVGKDLAVRQLGILRVVAVASGSRRSACRRNREYRPPGSSRACSRYRCRRATRRLEPSAITTESVPDDRSIGIPSPFGPILFCIVPSQSRPDGSVRASFERLPGSASGRRELFESARSSDRRATRHRASVTTSPPLRRRDRGAHHVRHPPRARRSRRRRHSRAPSCRRCRRNRAAGSASSQNGPSPSDAAPVVDRLEAHGRAIQTAS